jgi:hypothetical protein
MSPVSGGRCCGEFSTRRREIEAHLDEHGQHSARAAQFATYATRRAKDASIDAEGLVPGWRARAEAVGLDTEALAAVLDRGVVVEPPTPGSAAAERLYRWLASAEGLTARVSTFGEREVIKAICNALPAGGSVDRVLDQADGFLRSDHVLAVRLDRGTATIRRADGVVIPARTDQIRWTTPEMLEIEARIVTSALRRRSTGVGVATPAAVDAAVADSLRAAVRRSSAQRFALDELEAGSTPQLDQLRRERDLLRARLGHGPPDPSRDVRSVTEERRREQHNRDGARWRRNLALEDLDRRGPIGRRTRSARRRQIEDRIARSDAEIARHDSKPAALARQLEALTPVVADRTTWERQHGVELQRLENLDRSINLIERLDQIAMRNLNRRVERGLGVELGL